MSNQLTHYNAFPGKWPGSMGFISSLLSLRSCFKIIQVAHYGVKNLSKRLILLSFKLRFLAKLCLVLH